MIYFLIFIYEKEYASRVRGRRRRRKRESQADSTLSTEPDAGPSMASLRSRPEPIHSCDTISSYFLSFSLLNSYLVKQIIIGYFLSP